ncbi:MAG: tetratricopeptide repeat protein, partial [Candidatus Zixiibacteriota bacterium]
NMYLDQHQEIAAVTDFETVIRLDKHDPRGYIGLGQARYRLGQYSKAIKAFKDARSLDKTNPVVHRGLMHSYLKAGKIKDVVKAYKRFTDDVDPKEVARFNNDSANEAILRLVKSQER